MRRGDVERVPVAAEVEAGRAARVAREARVEAFEAARRTFDITVLAELGRLERDEAGVERERETEVI